MLVFLELIDEVIGGRGSQDSLVNLQTTVFEVTEGLLRDTSVISFCSFLLRSNSKTRNAASDLHFSVLAVSVVLSVADARYAVGLVGRTVHPM